MIIDRDKHNKYVAGWKPNYTVPTNQGSSSGTNVTIVYGGGGSGSSTPVSSEAFSYYKVSDGENAITQEAKVLKDIANLSIIGDEGIKVELITDPTIFEANFTSIGTNEGVYKISYGKVTTVVELPTKPETLAEEPMEPTEPEVIITFPMVLTYVSGEKIKAELFDTLRLLNDKEEVATYPSSGLAIEGDVDGILSISLEVYKEVLSVDEEGKPISDAEGNPVMEKLGLYFNKILLTSLLEDQPSTQVEGDSTEEEPQQPTYESLLSFDVVVNIDTVIKLSSDSGAGLWKLDDNGNIYTEYNAYSLKELSAYGPGEGEAGEGVSFLHELGDVSIPAPNEIPDNAILQYNIETDKWEAVEWSELDDTATREWVELKFKNLINGAPADLDTLGEIAIVMRELQQLLDWFSFVDGRIRANYDFWGIGEISAYGPASGSDPGTGGGAGYLHELGDVTINNDTLANGLIIVWDEDSLRWVNVDFSGLDESALALYLTLNKYATLGWVNSQLDPINNKLEEFQTTIDMINDMFEWDSGKIKAKATLYSVGEISAYGAGEGSSGIIGYLHELEDVLLTDLLDDLLLMYDASIGKWINVDKNSVGLNETELEQYLTTHNYVTSDRAVSPTRKIIAGTGLTGGGSLSADVTLSLATSGVTVGTYTKVTVDRYGRVTVGALLIEDDIPDIAWSKIHSTPTTLAGYGITDAYTMLQSDERYVNVIGDIMTGNLILPTLLANTSIILGSVKLEYDSANNALKVSNVNTQQAINLYATGEISAYGYNDGSSSTGGYLHELEDVTLSNLLNGQALVYNSSTGQWVNTTILADGIDEAALADYLTNNQYATQQWVTSQNYLTAVSVDTISDLHSSWDAVLKAQKPAWLTSVSLATISDLHANWDALLKAVPSAYVIRWPGVSEITGLQDALNLKLDVATFNDLFEKVEISTGVYAIRAKYGLYSNDWISAKGANTDAGGVVSGATDLDGLSDVTLTNIQNGQVLMYNGSQWVNSTLDVGLDETALAQYLTSHLYATQSWVNSQNYATEADLDARIDALVNGAPAAFDTLKEIADVLQGNVDSIGDILTALGNKADKTITITAGTGLTGGGNLSANRTLSLATVGTAGTYTKVTVDAYGRVTGHAALAAGDIPNLPWSKITSGKPTTLGGYGITDGVNAVSVTGSGNAVTTAKVSGHTLTLTKGSTFLLSSAYTAADVLAKLKTVDGSGSGLDADTLDGIHSASFDTVTSLGAASDYWYVVIGLLQITDYTTLGNMARGRLIATRQNGNNATVSIYYDISTQYNTTNVKFGYLNLGEGTVGQPCTFTYNGKKWAGFVFNLSSQYGTGYTCMRVGVKQGERSTPFLAHYYTTGENYSIINSEIYNSLSIGGDDIISSGIRTHNVVAQSSVKIGSGTISWDATNNCFHFSHGLYSDSFVSAKGANSGSGGTVSGVTKLSDLSDVQLGTLATNQVLSWNGSKWVNKAVSTGLDETALAQYLTNNQYLTMPTGDGRYALKGGSNATGTWSISISGTAAKVGINPSGLSAATYGSYLGVIQDSTTGPVNGNWYNKIKILHGNTAGYYTELAQSFTGTEGLWHRRMFNGSVSAWKTILDSSNYASTLDTRYVKKSGDTMTGALTVPSLAVSGSTATVSGNKVWHAGNDGSGSGLDADLLDGYHRSNLYSSIDTWLSTVGLTKTITVTGDKNTYYPVEITVSSSKQIPTIISIHKDLGSTTPDISGNHSSGTSSLWLIYEMRKMAWDGNGGFVRTVYKSQLYATLVANAKTNTQGGGNLIVWLRGGTCQYYVTCTNTFTATPYYTTTNVSHQTGYTDNVSPTTTISNGGIIGGIPWYGNITGNAATATQLQTAHTINGTAFNGTSNIVTSYWGTARNFYIRDHDSSHTGAAVSVNGSANEYLLLPSTITATLNGNATSASYWQTARTLAVSGDATGSVSIRGNANMSLSLDVKYATSAGNADTLDGVHNGGVTASYLYLAGNVSNFNTLTGNCIYAWGNNVTGQPNNYGSVFQFSNVNNPIPGTNQHWVTQLASSTNDRLYYRTRTNNGGWTSWHMLAFTTDNVYSATRLQTSQKIWGQPFNGTAPVSGNMTGVGDISFAGTNRLYWKEGGWGDQFAIVPAFSGSGDSNMLQFQSATGATGTTPALTTKMVIAGQSGNVGIGTTSPSYKLHVAGDIYATGWLRTNGQTGWYSQTYGGGIYMTDTTWVRLYGGKSFYAGDGIIRTNYLFDRQGYNGTSWYNGFGAYNVAISNNDAQTPLLLAYRSGQSQSVTGANRLFSMELLNSGSLMYLCFGGAMKYSLSSGGVFYARSGMYSDGYVSSKGQNQSSDERLKNIIESVYLDVSLIAKAPSFRFSWKDGKGVDVGSSAQYWKNLLPDAVRERDGYLEMGYGNIALVSVISIAKEVEKHSSDIRELKRRVKTLEEENKILKKRLSL